MKKLSMAAVAALLLLAAQGAAAQSVRLIFAGDLMGHMPQHNAALQPDGSYDYEPCFRHVRQYVQGADVAIVNLEVPLDGKPYSGYPQFSAPDALAEAAREAGFDIMTTANNHCLDRGRHGLERTLYALDSLGVPHLGTYRNEAERSEQHPMLIERNGLKIGLLTYTYGTNGIAVQKPNVVNMIDTAEMGRDLAEVRRRGAEFVVALMHWGIEYATHANAEQEQTARWLLEHGADAVIGGHPHVVQNFTLDAEPRNDVYPQVVVYSMGNLVSNQRDVNTDGGIMVELTLRREGGALRQSWGYMPYWVHRGVEGGVYQYYIVPSSDAVAYPEHYEIEGADLRALRLFDVNTRKRLEACRLPNGQNIEERRYYRRGLPLHPAAGGVVPLRGNENFGSRMQ